jgi:hypothetical protein
VILCMALQDIDEDHPTGVMHTPVAARVPSRSLGGSYGIQTDEARSRRRYDQTAGKYELKVCIICSLQNFCLPGLIDVVVCRRW